MNSQSAEIYVALKHIQAGKENLDRAWQKCMQELNALRLALSVAAVAAEKQLPYHPAEVYTVGSRKAYECKCGEKLTDKTAKYCKECGQLIDWPGE